MVQRGASDWGVMYDPYTGLALPERIESGSVQAVTGTPIVKTLDWVGLEFVPEIKVPAECWADWDAVNQKWITVGEKYPDGTHRKNRSHCDLSRQSLRYQMAGRQQFLRG